GESRTMQPFRASLRDYTGQEIAEVEGAIQSPEEAEGSKRGHFEFEDTGSFMDGVMEGKPFRLTLDDGSQLAIKVDSATVSSKPVYSVIEFSTLWACDPRASRALGLNAANPARTMRVGSRSKAGRKDADPSSSTRRARIVAGEGVDI